MIQEHIKHYFTDSQMAILLGITLGGFRNKIYKLDRGGFAKDKESLPKPIKVSRDRLWEKEAVRKYLINVYKGNKVVVGELMEKAERAGSNQVSQ